MKNTKFEIVAAQSNIDWTGKKVTGAHNGTIAIKEGSLQLNDGKLTSGLFVIDSTSIKILDITDPATNAQFAGHLASDDFFSVEKYPAATFKITSAIETADSHYHIEGNLTIKGITHPAGFEATVNVLDNTLNASGKVMVDRTKYDMKFRSGNFFQNLGDTLIYNEFELTVHLTAKAVL